MASAQGKDLSEHLRDTEAALSLLANLLKADPGLGLEMAQMPVPGGSATDLPSMLAAALNLLCGLPTPPIHVIGLFFIAFSVCHAFSYTCSCRVLPCLIIPLSSLT